MIIKSYEIWNFKSIRYSGVIDFNKNVVLIGHNNSGKSNLCQSLILLKQTFDNKNSNSPLTLNGEIFNFGNYKDIIYLGDFTLPLVFRFNFIELNNSFSISFMYNFQVKTNTIILIRVLLKKNNSKKWILKCFNDKFELNFYDDINSIINIKFRYNKFHYFPDHSIIKYVFTDLINLQNCKITIKPGIYVNPSKEEIEIYTTLMNPDNFENILNKILEENCPDSSKIFKYLIEFFDASLYLSSSRNIESRVRLVQNFNPKNVGIKGENSADLLYYDQHISGGIIQILNQWLQKLCFNIQIEKINTFNEYYEILVKNENFSQNIINAGCGFKQILPILLECLIFQNMDNPMYIKLTKTDENPNSYYSINRRFFIIEEPEVHLNPRIQSILCDFFIETSENSIFKIIETHSQHILNRFQRRIVEKKYISMDLSLYFVSRNKSMSNILNVKISEKGDFVNFPEDFFEEEYKDSIAILKQINMDE